MTQPQRITFVVLLSCIAHVCSYEDDGNFHPLRVKPHDVFPELLQSPKVFDRRLQSQCDGLSASDPGRFSPPCCGTTLDQDPCCEPCYNMTVCSALTNKLVEDRYYPTLANLGSCDNIEDRVNRLDIFGPGRTFREEAGCRQLVYDYVCLFWASEAFDIHGVKQYENRCPAILNDATGELIEPPKHPCRSFCTQIAQLCAQRDTWMQNCEHIACPPIDEECTPGPYQLRSQEACLIHYIQAPIAAAESVQPSGTVIFAVLLATSVLAQFVRT